MTGVVERILAVARGARRPGVVPAAEAPLTAAQAQLASRLASE